MNDQLTLGAPPIGPTGDEQAAAARAARAVAVRLDHVTKRFRGGVEAISDVSLTIAPGEFMVLVGPSGCGKSTLLRMIAGLEEVSAGHVHIGDRDVTSQLPQHRDVAMVFQSYALYPRMSVRRNLGFGLRMRRTPRADRAQRVEQVASLLGLTNLLDRRPAALSGGQRQRVAMGRAIVREPRVFLMDEPLSNLDAKLRVSMRSQLSQLHQRLGITTVYVTHDQIEAMTLGQRVAVLRDGTLQQCATPQELFQRPANLFVAAFIGSPSMNLVHAQVGGGAVRFDDVVVPLPEGSPMRSEERDVVMGLRPTGLHLAAAGQTTGIVECVPHLIEELGDERYVLFEVDAPAVDTQDTRAAVALRSTEDLLLVSSRAQFTARLPLDAPVTVGAPLRLAVDPARLHFFDPATGEALL